MVSVATGSGSAMITRPTPAAFATTPCAGTAGAGSAVADTALPRSKAMSAASLAGALNNRKALSASSPADSDTRKIAAVRNHRPACPPCMARDNADARDARCPASAAGRRNGDARDARSST